MRTMTTCHFDDNAENHNRNRNFQPGYYRSQRVSGVARNAAVCGEGSPTGGRRHHLAALHAQKDAEGNHLMSVRAGSPGGSRFPKRHFLRARDKAPAFLDAFQDKVFIQTIGPGGVRIKEKGGAWYVIEGVRNDVVVDAEGAGDTYTSAFINAMADEKTVVDAAREAMKMASRSVGFLGSKGMFQR